MKASEFFRLSIIGLLGLSGLGLAPGAKVAAQIASDDFNQSSIKSAVWTPVDPVGDGLFETVGAGSGDAHLRITVPAGRNHDAWNPNESPRSSITLSTRRRPWHQRILRAVRLL